MLYEYIWLDIDGKTRSKTMVIDSSLNEFITPSQLPVWNYDGSSTGQAKGKNTEINLYPIKIVTDPLRNNSNNKQSLQSYLVLCDIDPKYSTRVNADSLFKKYESYEFWFGLEQEYFILNDLNNTELDKTQGQYYCGVGGRDPIERQIAEEHLSACLTAGLNISGINAEVANGQWEFQVGIAHGIDACDQLFIARYLLERIAEKYSRKISYEPKLDANTNGSGCHVNISTKETRGENGIEFIYSYLNKLAKVHHLHIKRFGENNNKRLTGKHETSSYDTFSWGIGTRDTSIRIGNKTYDDKKGYFEDRRPAANMNPYIVLSLLALRICSNN
jgi:glutamine synthetase